MALHPDAPLAQFAGKWRAKHSEQSGFQPLSDGLDALGARLRALDIARHTVDVQYFLIKHDEAGSLFMGKLLRAADSGVRVRVLFDDIFTPRNDVVLTTLASHPNINIRLFNPLSRRFPVLLSMLWDFQRSNRRMHNKSFIVDGSLAIIGGRNIGAEYFELQQDGNFDDYEVLATGPVVDDIADTFDRFWDSRLALPVEALGRRPLLNKLAIWRNAMRAVVSGRRESAYGRAVKTQLVDAVFRGELPLIPAPARVVADRPEKLKVAPGTAEELRVTTALREAIEEAQHEITIISPYFIPGEEGLELIKNKAASGITVRVVTNSLASTNHVAVHAHYRKYRAELVRSGVELFELRSDVQPGYGEKNIERITLHTKAFEVDGKTLILGSLNLDPRSMEINSEQIVFIDSPELSGLMRDVIDKGIPDFTWRVALSDKDRMRWTYAGARGRKTRKGEPGASLWRRLLANVYQLLPIERQL